MLKRLFAIVACALLPAPGMADMLSGADDPYFIAAAALALGTDDPRARHDLYALASAGNVAARVALPTVERWLPPPSGLLKDRAAFRKINGVPVTDLANAASPIAALWLQGAVSDDMAVQLDRATQLYARGEPTKADTLLAMWLNSTGGYSALPVDFADLPASARLKVAIIEGRLNPFVGNPTPDIAGDMAILTAWLAADRIEGWMVLARVTGRAGDRTLSPEATTFGRDLLAKSLARTPPDLARLSDARIGAAALVWNATSLHRPDAPLSDADVQTILQELAPRPEFTPVSLYCNAHCPAAPAACQRAYLQAFGHQTGNFSWFEPQSDAISPAAFYASPRGERLLLSNGVTYGLQLPPDRQGDVAAIMAIPSLATAARTDACLAAAVTRVLTTALPTGP